MDTPNLSVGIDKKAFNLKHVITTVLTVVIVAFIISKLFRNTMVLRNNAGEQTGTANLSFSPFWKK